MPLGGHDLAAAVVAHDQLGRRERLLVQAEEAEQLTGVTDIREAAAAYARRQAEQNAPAETHLIGA